MDIASGPRNSTEKRHAADSWADQLAAVADSMPGTSLARLAVPPRDAAKITGRTRTRIFQAIKDGELTARKDGKATLIEISELARWIRSMPTRGRQPGPSMER